LSLQSARRSVQEKKLNTLALCEEYAKEIMVEVQVRHRNLLAGRGLPGELHFMVGFVGFSVQDLEVMLRAVDCSTDACIPILGCLMTSVAIRRAKAWIRGFTREGRGYQ
jgi:hypothetical protein